MQRNSFPNHKGKDVATVVIFTDLGEDEEESPTLLTVAITTLQKSSKFKNLFDQLRLTMKERKIATKAPVSIVLGARIECLTAEVADDRALLQESGGLLLSSIYKSNSHQESLGGYKRFCKSHPTKHFTSCRNFRKEDLGMPNESDRIWGKRQIHRRPHSAVVEGGPYSLSSSFPCGENGSLISCMPREAMVAQALISLIHLSSMCERNVE